MMLKITDADKAVLKVPKSVSEQKIKEFLENKSAWLKKTANKIAENKQFSTHFDTENFVYLNGEKFMSVKELSLDFDKQTASKQARIIKNFYLSHFDTLVDLSKQMSAQTGLKFNEIKPINSVRVWGSYNSKGVMKLNLKLLILPKYLAEYVIAHELCHSLHMNHSPKFWADVSKICPNFKIYRKELQKYGFLLKEERS